MGVYSFIYRHTFVHRQKITIVFFFYTESVSWLAASVKCIFTWNEIVTHTLIIKLQLRAIPTLFSLDIYLICFTYFFLMIIHEHSRIRTCEQVTHTLIYIHSLVCMCKNMDSSLNLFPVEGSPSVKHVLLIPFGPGKPFGYLKKRSFTFFFQCVLFIDIILANMTKWGRYIGRREIENEVRKREMKIKKKRSFLSIYYVWWQKNWIVCFINFVIWKEIRKRTENESINKMKRFSKAKNQNLLKSNSHFYLHYLLLSWFLLLPLQRLGSCAFLSSSVIHRSG